MPKYPIAALFLAACLPNAAHAQDQPIRGFTGAHVGLDTVYDWDESQQPGSNTAKSRGGFGVRGHIGLDMPVASTVLVGAEFGIGTGGRTSDQASLGGGRYRVNPGVNYDLTGRIGIALHPSVMVYAKAGYHWMEREVIISGQATGNATNKATQRGFRYGGGVELHMTPECAMRIEVSHSSLGDSLRQTRVSFGPLVRF